MLAAGLLLWFLLPYALGGHGFPLGPDAPVYLWWTRLAGVDGLSAVGHRPGVPALALALEGTLGLTGVEVIAALEGALGVCVGLASAALVRAADARRATWVTAGVLAGTFSVHLAAGYLANLAFAVAFLGAAGALAAGTRRGAVAAAFLLGAGGLAHSLFFLLGAITLSLSAALAWRSERAEAVRVGAATLGGGALLGVGLLALLAGPGPLEVDTSKDGFLRRAGLVDELRSAYLDRFVQRWARYVEWASVPLAIAGLRDAGGFLGRFLRAWGLVTIVGVGVALASGLAPADRFVTFGFVVPILAAFGLVRLWDALASRRVLAVAAAGALGVAMLAGAWIAWDRQEPFISGLEALRVSDAAPWIAAAEARTTLVFPVNADDPEVTFLATRAGNVIRAGVPADRIRDVVVVVPAPASDETPSPVRAALSRVTLGDANAATAASGGRHLDVLLAPFDRVDVAGANTSGSPWTRVSAGVFLSDAGAGDVPRRSSELRPSSPGGIAWSTIAVLAIAWVVGYGWARAALQRPVQAAALAPTFGAAALTIAAIALERLGRSVTGGNVSGSVISAVAAGGGYVAWLVLERRARTRATPQVEQQPEQ